MVLYQKDFSKENLEVEDLWRVAGIDDETAKKIEMITDKEIVALNRARRKALFLTEEIKGEIFIEENENSLKITICKEK